MITIIIIITTVTTNIRKRMQLAYNYMTFQLWFIRIGTRIRRPGTFKFHSCCLHHVANCSFPQLDRLFHEYRTNSCFACGRYCKSFKCCRLSVLYCCLDFEVN